MNQIKLMMVGGFLGAGKTTLIGQTVQIFTQQGYRVGLVTNDQTHNLVDTSIHRVSGIKVEEIAGGCFCCRFDDLADVLAGLSEGADVDILIGEPVGSCTDISATVLQPLKDRYADRYHLTPFSVLVDPVRLMEVIDPRLSSSLHPSARYILRKQLEEADIIVINKIDLLSSIELSELQARTRESFPHNELVCLSALNGDGIQAWLDMALSGGPSGQHITDVDYDTYAEGEAVLGWLNAAITLSSSEPVDWDIYPASLLQRLREACKAESAEIAHIKIILEGTGSTIIANITGNDSAIRVRGSLPGDPSTVKMILNARVDIDSDRLQSLVTEALTRQTEAKIMCYIDEMTCLSPGRPVPMHRYATVVTDKNLGRNDPL